MNPNLSSLPPRPLWVTVGGESEFRLWKFSSDQEDGIVVQTGPFHASAISRDNQTLATGHSNGTILLWDLTTGTERDLLRGHDYNVNFLYFAEDGRTLISIGEDGSLKTWETDSEAYQDSLQLSHGDRRVQGLKFLPDGERLAVRSLYSMAVWTPRGGVVRVGTITVWNSATLEQVYKEKIFDVEFTALALSPDGKTLAAAGDGGLLKLWRWTDGTAQPVGLKSHRRVCSALLFSRDGTRLISGGGGELKSWDVATHQQVASWRNEGVFAIALSPNGKVLATGTDDEIRLWRAPEMPDSLR